jgi:hypothetical protein
MRRIKDAEKEGLPHLIAKVFEDLHGWYKKGLATEYPQPQQRNGASWLVYPIWPRAGMTVIAAASNSFKSFIAQGIDLQLHTGTEVMAGNTRTTAQTKYMY